MSILIIEDDAKTGDYLRKGLREHGYNVDLARNGVDGLYMALDQDYELVVLDIMLPGLTGWDVIQQLRAKRDVPVIVLSARDEVSDRIRTILRRGAARETEVFEVADLRLDLVRRRVTRGGVEIALTNKEFLLLHLLLRREGEVLTRTQIASEVWDMNFDSDTNVVDVAVKRLRAKIDGPFERKLIATIRGAGYSLRAEP